MCLRRPADFPDGVVLARSFDDAVAVAGRPGSRVETLYVFGGHRVYADAFAHPDCLTVYATRVRAEFECDAFVPDYTAAGFVPFFEQVPVGVVA